MNGPFAHDFWWACEVELDTLTNDMKTWTLVLHTTEMKSLPSTWASKVKRYPDGAVKKFKARYCTCGDRQEHGGNCWETWSPVVSWPTIQNPCDSSCEGRTHISSMWYLVILPRFFWNPNFWRQSLCTTASRLCLNRDKQKQLVCHLNSCHYRMRQSPRYLFWYHS